MVLNKVEVFYWLPYGPLRVSLAFYIDRLEGNSNYFNYPVSCIYSDLAYVYGHPFSVILLFLYVTFCPICEHKPFKGRKKQLSKTVF